MKTFETIYQAAGAGTGKTVQFDVYKPDKTLDATQSGMATEIGTTGRYHFSFDADAPGWSCEISDNAGGKAVKHFGKDKWDSHGVADAVADVQTGVNAANSALAALDSAITGIDSKVDAIDTNVTGVATAVTALGTQLSTIEAKVDALAQPPMVG